MTPEEKATIDQHVQAIAKVGVYFTFQKLQHELLGAPESLQGIQQSSKSLNCADE
jgi:hypothetical protein